MDQFLNEFEDKFRAGFLPDLEQTLQEMQHEKYMLVRLEQTVTGSPCLWRPIRRNRLRGILPG